MIRTFYLSHADAQEMVQLLNVIGRVQGSPIVPAFVANKNQNSVTVRATAPLVAIMERIIESNDRPRAEVIVDVQILEVNRSRAKQFGLDLSNYSVTGIFSPEKRPTTGEGGSVTTQPFNLNTITAGISAADFYLAVPTAVVRFLESDSQTKLVAKPQLRGREGEEIKLNLGDRFPVPSTTFGSLGGAGSVATQPISSFTYEPVGIIVNMTPRVTFDGDIVLKLVVESSTLGQDVNIAGQNLPSFGSRKVETTLRLRDGESTLLAGLLREDQQRTLTGFPGLMRLPVFRQLFTNNDLSSGQTDIVMLLTPRIVRTHELTQEDVNPVYIGSQQNLGLTGPPPLIAAPAGEEPAAPTPPGVTGQPTPMPREGTLPQPGIVPERPAPAPPPPPPRRRPVAAARTVADAATAGNRRRPGRGQRRAAGRDATRPGDGDGRGALHGPRLGEQRAARLHALGDDHLQPGAGARAVGAGRQLHAPGRRDGELQPADRPGCRPRRHHGRPKSRRRRCLGHWTGGGAGSRAGRAGQHEFWHSRDGHRARRRAHYRDLHARGGDGEVV